MVNRNDYESDEVAAARSVMIELIHLLGEYRGYLVLVGAWVPELLLSSKSEPHVGSLDIDLAVNHSELAEEGYRTILELHRSRGYEQGNQPFIFLRKVKMGDREITVHVDLLAAEYGGTEKSHRHQKVQDIHARKVRGCDLAFTDPVEMVVDGELPTGGKDSVRIQVASIISFLVMKGMALDDRLKEKDAWDIYYCLKHYPGGLDALVETIKPHLEHGLLREGFEKIAKHFVTTSHAGPFAVAEFEAITDPEERELIQRDAYERVNYVLQKLGI